MIFVILIWILYLILKGLTDPLFLLGLITIGLAALAWREAHKTNKIALEESEFIWLFDLQGKQTNLPGSLVKNSSQSFTYHLFLRNYGMKTAQKISVKGYFTCVDLNSNVDQYYRVKNFLIEKMEEDEEIELEINFTNMLHQNFFNQIAHNYIGKMGLKNYSPSNSSASQLSGQINVNILFTGIVSAKIYNGTGKLHVKEYINLPLTYLR